MIYLTNKDISDLLTFAGVSQALVEAFTDLAHGNAAIHSRQRTDCSGTRLSTMGAVWKARDVAGVKVYPTVAGRFCFAVLLFDLVANAPLAFLDGDELTRLRTAAMTAMVATRAARPHSRKLALFGAGLQGRSQALALAEIFAFDEIHVVDPAADPGWCERLQATSRARVGVSTPEQAVRGADIVVTATRSGEPVFDGAWLSPGAFVAAMGTSTAKGRELDDATMVRARRVILEWMPQSSEEAGEVVLWQAQRDLDKLVDLPQLFGGERPWQGDANDITVFKSVGVCLADVAAATLACSLAQERAALPGGTTS